MPTVLITGTSRGLGLEFTRQYAADGWKVIATCRDPAGAGDLGAVQGDVAIEPLDVRDPGAIGALAEKLSGEAIDVLINNAGIYGPRPVTMDSVDFEAWDGVFRTNAMAPLAVTAAFAPQVARSADKVVATVTSRMGSIADNEAGGDYTYRSSKAAVNAVMKSLAVDLGNVGIKVVLLHPGWVRTDMGGAGAAIDPPESIAGMRAVIAGLDASDSGGFFNYDGRPLPW